MDLKKKTKVCMVPRLTGIGGMVSFQNKLVEGLNTRGIDVSFDLSDLSSESVLIVGGTKQIPGLWRARSKGVRIIQRLDGMNWLHRVRPTGLQHYLRAEYGNMILQLIRSRLAQRIVYQSQFARSWWNKGYGSVEASDSVIYNGVDLQVFSPDDTSSTPTDRIRVLLVEGRLAGGYESGLENGVQLVREMKSTLNSTFNSTIPGIVELAIAGRVDPQIKANRKQDNGVIITYLEQVVHDFIPAIDRSAHMLFSADLNAACPNSVIEALACGTPVVSFDTGALPEIVNEHAGIIVPYGGDPWRLEPPDIKSLAKAAIEVYLNQMIFRVGARRHAESAFSLDTMVDRYIETLLD